VLLPSTQRTRLLLLISHSGTSATRPATTRHVPQCIELGFVPKHLQMDAPMSDLVGTALTLDQLPSELRRLIVSFLSPLRLRPGSKKDLKNANLAHRCLHEWATEYIFHEMTLLHVLPGISSQLERFSLQEECIALHKLVKRIEIRVRLQFGNSDMS
jgi:hypothetical protein